MSDRPILFSGPMIKALLAGRKTQTRRLLKGVPLAPEQDSLVHPPKHAAPYFDAYCGGKRSTLNPRGMTGHWCWWTRDDRCGNGCKVPFVPGDRLWVKETWRVDSAYNHLRPSLIHDKADVDYLADGQMRRKGKTRVSIFMPRWASRLTLIVTDVRVQRLQECSTEDAIAEGASCWICGTGRIDGTSENDCGCFHSKGEAIRSYAFLWNTINGEGSWEANPWIVAVSFDVIRENITRLNDPLQSQTRRLDHGH